MPSSRLSNSIRNIIFGLLKYSISIVIPFFIRTILIYKIGTEYAGVSSLFSSILQVLNLTELGFSSAVVYALYKPIAENNKEKISAYLALFKKIYRICGLIILGLGIFLCPFLKYLIKGNYPSDINLYFVFIVQLLNSSISYLFCGYKSAIFIAFQRNDIESKAQIIGNLFLYLSQVCSIIIFRNYYLYVISNLLSTILNNILYDIFSRKLFVIEKEFEPISDSEKKELYTNVGALFGHQLDAVIITSADNVVISSFIGLNFVTIYNNYYYIISALISILIMIANSFVASIGNSIAIETKDKNYDNFIKFSYAFGFINNVCTIILLALFQDFMAIWMGKGMLFEFDTVLLLVFSLYIRQIRRTVLTYKNAIGLWKYDKYKPYIAAILNLVINILLVKIIGINGVIISTILSMILVEFPWETKVLHNHYFEKKQNKFYYIQLNLLIKFMVSASLIYYFSTFIPANSIGVFLIKLLIVSILTLGLMIIISVKDIEFQYCIQLISVYIKAIKNRF